MSSDMYRKMLQDNIRGSALLGGGYSAGALLGGAMSESELRKRANKGQEVVVWIKDPKRILNKKGVIRKVQVKKELEGDEYLDWYNARFSEEKRAERKAIHDITKNAADADKEARKEAIKAAKEAEGKKVKRVNLSYYEKGLINLRERAKTRMAKAMAKSHFKDKNATPQQIRSYIESVRNTIDPLTATRHVTTMSEPEKAAAKAARDREYAKATPKQLKELKEKAKELTELRKAILGPAYGRRRNIEEGKSD